MLWATIEKRLSQRTQTHTHTHTQKTQSTTRQIVGEWVAKDTTKLKFLLQCYVKLIYP